MAERLFDIYGVIGLLISIAATLYTIYSSPKEIPLEYIFIFVIGIGILGIVMVLLNKFSNIDNQLQKSDNQIKSVGNKIDKQEYEVGLLNKRFKTLENLSDIRLDIRELKREVFKK